MAVNPETAFVGKIKPSSGPFPYGEAQDVTVAGDGTGTPWKALLLNDIFGFQQALLADAGIVPSGTPDTALVSQYLSAMGFASGRVVDTVADLASATSQAVVGSIVTVRGYLSVGDGGGGRYLIKTAAQAATDGDVVDEVGNHTILAGFVAIIQDVYHTIPERFGGVGDDATNSSPAFDSIKGNLNAESVQIAAGKIYRCTADVEFDRDIAFSGTGTINCIGSTFRIAGALVDNGNLTAAVAKGIRVIPVSDATGMVPGSLLCIQNQVASSFSPHRTNYFDGEFAEVLSVAGLNITLTAPTETSYAGAATDKVFLVNPVTTRIDGVKFRGDTSYLLTLFANRNSQISGADVEGGAFGALRIDKSFNFEVIGGRYFHDAVAASVNYGIVILNSQDGDVYSADTYGTRHGTSTGGDAADGAVPNRRIRFHDCKIDSDGTLYAADFHGNTVDSGYYNCHSSNNVGLAGRNVEWVGGTVVGGTGNAPLGYHELVGGFCRFSGGVRVSLSAASTATRIVGNLGSSLTANITEDYIIDAHDVEAELTSDIIAFCVAFNNAGATIENDWRLDNLKLTGDLSALAAIIASTISGTGKRPRSVHVDEIDADISALTSWMTKTGGSFAGTVATMPKLTFRESLTMNIADTESTAGGTAGALICDYPTYPEVPDIFHTHSGTTLDGAGPGYLITAGVLPATTTHAEIKMASGDIGSPVTVAKTAIVSAKVGMDKITFV